jgi:hypothetical protein
MKAQKKSSARQNKQNFFQYKPLQTNQYEFRLLTFDTGASMSNIHCKLKSAPIDKAPVYSALSYTWGDPSVTHTIFVNGQQLQVTSNLYNALYNFRDLYPRIRLWADAVCIDQNNLEEKGQQIQLMQKIFSRAIETLVWLGIEEDESSKAFDLIELCSKRYTSRCSVPPSNSIVFDFGHWGPPSSWKAKEEFVALERFLARPWWYRIWVVQEVAVSKKVWVYCGNRKCSWDVVANAAEFLLWDINNLRHIITQSLEHSQVRLFLTGGLDRIVCIDSAHSAFQNDISADKETNSARSLFHLLSDNCSAHATDSRDKCVGLAGLAYEGVFPLAAQIYLQTPSDIYTFATRSIIMEEESGRLKFLEYSVKPLQRSDLLSWVPDWSYTGDRPKALLFRQLEQGTDRAIVPYHSATGSRVLSGSSVSVREDDTLSAYGFVFDSVDGVSVCDCDGLGSFAIHTPEEDLEILQPEYVIQEPSDENLADIVAKLWRTLVLDRDDLQGLPPENWARLLFTTLLLLDQVDDVDLDYESSCVKRWYSRNKPFKICGSTTLEDIVSMQGNCSSNISSAEHDAMAEIRARICLITNLKRFSNTKKGHLALMPADTRRGDIVAILFDCDLPVVLRPRERQYTFVGCCYVHGIMEGQAMAGLDRGEFTAETFDIR